MKVQFCRPSMPQKILWMAPCACLLAACAAGIRSSPTSLQLAARAEQLDVYTLDAGASFKLSTSYERILRASSRWSYVGQLAAGRVFRPIGDAFSIEGAHVHEAYLVVDSERLVGFYLPFERSFSPLDPPILLNLRKN